MFSWVFLLKSLGVFSLDSKDMKCVWWWWRLSVLIVHPCFPPPPHNTVLANSQQIWQKAKVSKTMKFLQLFLLLLLNSTGRGGERWELLLTLRGKRQPLVPLLDGGQQWVPPLHPEGCGSPCPAWQDVEQSWAVEGQQSEDGAEMDKCRGMAVHKS